MKPTASIHELPPMEIGGVEARRGFGIQDHVSLSYCLELLAQNSLKEVWCESQDDVTLIWDKDGQDKVEFVQVKGSELDQLWSIAKLCERKTTDDHSVLERSLAYDRCCELCCFRIVTIRPVQKELKPLTYPIESPARIQAQPDISDLITQVGKKVGNFKSENGNGYDFWISHIVWQEIHSLESLENENKLKLLQLVHEEYLLSDQLTELYRKLLVRVNIASMTRWLDDPERKKFKKKDFTEWFEQQLTNIVNPLVTKGETPIQMKMATAGISQDNIDSANNQRRSYKEELLKPNYLKLRDTRLIEGEIVATLLNLRTQLDAGFIVSTGREFHATCLQELDDLRNQLSISPPPPLAFLQGCMYNIVNRCLHRFVRGEM